MAEGGGLELVDGLVSCSDSASAVVGCEPAVLIGLGKTVPVFWRARLASASWAALRLRLSASASRSMVGLEDCGVDTVCSGYIYI